MNIIDSEINELRNEIQELSEKLNMMNANKRMFKGTELANLEIDIALLESDIESETKRCDNLLELRNYQNICDHEFVEDLVDITPDKSVVIKYCCRCLFSCE